MSKIHNFLGLQWIAGEGIPQYQTPLPGDGEPYYAVTSVQLRAMLGMIELALEATSGAIRSTDPSSWLVGFQAGFEASTMHRTASLDQTGEKSRARQEFEDTGSCNKHRSETSNCSASQSLVFQSSNQSSDSSSVEVGESTGELPTPSCTKIVIPDRRLFDITFDDAAKEWTITLKSGGGWK